MQQIQIGNITYRVQRVYGEKQTLADLLAQRLAGQRLPKSGFDDKKTRHI